MSSSLPSKKIKKDDQNQYPTFAHHAYVCAREITSFDACVEEIARSFDITLPHNDIAQFDFSSTRIGIDDAHKIREAILRTPITQQPGYTIVVIQALQIGIEAQNALLKSFEEPPQHTKIFLIVPRLEILLETLRSRLVPFSLSEENKINHNSEIGLLSAKDFVSAKKSERIALISKIHSGLDKGNIHIGQLYRFVDSVEALVANTKRAKKALEAVVMVQTYIRNGGSSPKMLLEYLALHLD